MIRKLTIILSLVSLTFAGRAQVKTAATYLSSVAKRADHLYRHQYYHEAVELYQQALRKDPENARLKLQIAESFRQLNDPVQAAWWYGRVIHEKEVIEAQHQLFYAQALLSSGQVPEAEAWYARYQQSYTTDERTSRKLRGIDQMPTFYRDSLMYRVRPMRINSSASDFAPAFYQDGLVFVSARETKQAVKQVFRWNETPYLNLLFTPLNEEDKPVPPTLFSKSLGSNYHEGPAIFYDNDTRIIFTHNNARGKRNSQRVSKLGLFTAVRSKNGKNWSSPDPLSLNNPEYSVGHPALTQNGQTLYFISDRPGGFGGTDLYVSHFQNDAWQSPVNLGPSVNTEGNEMFPFLHQDQTLYFASDGHGGLGGLDVYKTELGSERVENVGYPVNSSYDDFGLILNPEGTQGYYASNREGKVENDDLYQVAIAFHYLDIAVSDEYTQQPISEAEVSLIGDGAVESMATSKSDGTVRFRVNPHHTYIVNVDKTNYEGNALIVSPDEMLATEEGQATSVTLAREEGSIDLTFAVTNSYTRQPIPYTVVSVVRTEDSDTTYRMTDEQGMIRMRVGNRSRYMLSGEVDGIGWSCPELSTQLLNTQEENIVPIAIGAKDRTIPLRVMTYDTETNAPVEQVVVRLIEDGEQRAELRTQANGEASFEVDPSRSYLISLEALTHYDDAVIIMSEELLQDTTFRVDVPLSNAEGMISVVANLYDSITGAPVANTVVRLRKEGTHNEITSVSDKQGNVRFKVEREGSYRIRGGGEQSWDYHQPLKIEGNKTRLPQWRIPAKAVSYQPKTSRKQILATQSPSEESTENTKQQLVSSSTEEQPSATSLEKLQTTVKTGNVKQAALQSLIISVVEENTGQPIPEAEVILIGEGAVEAISSGDANGRVNFSIDPTEDYIVDVSRAGYQGNAIILASKILRANAESSEIPIALKRETGTVALTARLYDERTDQAIAYTLVHLVNTTTSDTISRATDQQGKIQVKADKQSSYRLSGNINGKAWSYPAVDVATLNVYGKNQLSIPVEVTAVTTPLRVVALDANTGQPIEWATVRLIEDGTQRALLRTEKSGEALFDVDPHNSYLISIEPLSHYDEVAIVMSEELTSGVEYRIELLLASAQGTINLEAQLYDSLTRQPLANTVVHIRHEHTGEEMTTLSDEQGTIRMKVASGASYQVSGRVKGQTWSYDTRINISDSEAALFDMNIPVYRPLSYEGLLAEVQPGHNLVHTDAPKGSISQEELAEATFIVVGSEQEEKSQQVWAEVGDRIYQLLPEGHWQHQGEKVTVEGGNYVASDKWQAIGNRRITIRNVYFSFDAYSISSKAAQELDKIVALMKRQPSLHIEVDAHADSRGSGTYNHMLSRKRAQAILAYLVRKEIAESRIYLNVYGEERPRQPCHEDCSESIHQLNRRGEFSLQFM